MQSAATPFIFASFAYRVGQFGFLGQWVTLAGERDSYDASREQGGGEW